MISWVDNKFTAWGRWVQLGRCMGSKGLSAAWGAVGSGTKTASSFVPAISIDCSRLNDWVLQLSQEEQVVMVQVYCTEKTSREHAQALNMSLRTLYARLHSLQVSYTRRHREVAN